MDKSWCLASQVRAKYEHGAYHKGIRVEVITSWSAVNSIKMLIVVLN